MIWQGTDMNHMILSVQKKKDGIILESKTVNLYCKNDEEYYNAIEKFESEGFTDIKAQHDVPLSDDEWEDYCMGEVF